MNVTGIPDRYKSRIPDLQVAVHIRLIDEAALPKFSIEDYFVVFCPSFLPWFSISSQLYCTTEESLFFSQSCICSVLEISYRLKSGLPRNEKLTCSCSLGIYVIQYLSTIHSTPYKNYFVSNTSSGSLYQKFNLVRPNVHSLKEKILVSKSGY